MPEAPQAGRHVPTIAECLLWEQRVQKEEHYNARQSPKYCIRNAVSVLDVPGKFKPGHVDPVKDDRGLQPFNPADNNWDPEGTDAREFRMCMNRQRAGPRDRQPYPLTSAQEHGWSLAPQGIAADRVRVKKNRMGIGWECKHPSEWSASTAMPPPALAGRACEAGAQAEARADGARSSLSCAPPAVDAPSAVSAAPPASVLPNAAPDASRVSRAAPSALSGASRASASSLSAATSLPDIHSHPAERLDKRERRLGKAMVESARYLSIGSIGHRYSRPLGMTDATQFDNDFTKAAGVPLYKTVGSDAPTLKMKNGLIAPKWK